jgi:hypothetical protein
MVLSDATLVVVGNVGCGSGNANRFVRRVIAGSVRPLNRVPIFPEIRQEFDCARGGMLIQNNSSQVWPLLWFRILNSGWGGFPEFSKFCKP